MFILTVHWDLRALWEFLTVTAKVYVLVLLLAAIYSASVIIRIASRLHRLRKNTGSTSTPDFKVRLIALTEAPGNLRQFHMLLFFLFGIVCTNEIFAALRGIRYSLMSLSADTINIFEPVAAFAFCVLVGLTFLHVAQWIMAARLQSYRTANFQDVYLFRD